MEDATSLQCAIMKVIELLRGGHANYRECALLLCSLRIASMNLKAFSAERAEREAAASGKSQAALGNKPKSEPGEDETLAGMLLGLLTTEDDGSNTEPPVNPAPEGYCAAMEGKRSSAGLQRPAGSKNVSESRIA